MDFTSGPATRRLLIWTKAVSTQRAPRSREPAKTWRTDERRTDLNLRFQERESRALRSRTDARKQGIRSRRAGDRTHARGPASRTNSTLDWGWASICGIPSLYPCPPFHTISSLEFPGNINILEMQNFTTLRFGGLFQPAVPTRTHSFMHDHVAWEFSPLDKEKQMSRPASSPLGERPARLLRHESAISLPEERETCPTAELLWAELSPSWPQNSHVDVLAPSTSQRDCLWR